MGILLTKLVHSMPRERRFVYADLLSAEDSMDQLVQTFGRLTSKPPSLKAPTVNGESGVELLREQF